MDVALWRCLFSQLFCFSLKSESESNWKRNAKAIYPVLSMQKKRFGNFNFGKLTTSRVDSKTLS